MKLRGKVALVTGSSRGIGKAVAKRLAEEGCKVIINCRASVAEAKNFEKSLKGHGIDCIFIRADVSEEMEVKALLTRVFKKYKSIDILVNNAGIYRKADRNGRVGFQEYLDFHKTNSWGVYLCCREFGKIMSRGVIINISSIYGIQPEARSPIASGAKAEVESFTKSFAKLYKGRIRVNAVAPGYTDTALLQESLNLGTLKCIKQKMIHKRLIKPEEIAHVVIFLAENENVTGQTIVVDGGFLLE